MRRRIVRLRTTLAAAILPTAIALPMSLFTATAAQADDHSTSDPSDVCHTVQVDKNAITKQSSCITGPVMFAKPNEKAKRPKGF
jgi:hypothetical protein